jgi:hypothetical protein
MFGIHYGHYKAAIKDKHSTKVLAQQLTVIARSGIPPESWSIGLQVMLEEIAGGMSSGETMGYSVVQGRLQLLLPIHVWLASNANADRLWIHT